MKTPYVKSLENSLPILIYNERLAESCLCMTCVHLSHVLLFTVILNSTVAALSLRIKKMMEHLRINRKDYSCKRSMLHLVHRRRKLLLLLKSLRPNSYHDILQDLKLRHPVNPIFQLKQHPGRKKK